MPLSGKSRTAPRRVLRVLLPALLILTWIAATGVAGPYFERVDEVSTNDNSAFLPESAEATQVQERLPEFFDNDSVPAVAIVTADEPLTEEYSEAIDDASSQIAEVDGVLDGLSPAIPSEDGQAAQIFVPTDAQSDTADVVADMRDVLDDELPSDLTSHVTGPAGFTADLSDAFAGIDGLLLGVALTAVFIILLAVYRSFLLPITVLTTSVCALSVALLTVWWLASADILTLTGQTQGILFILVIGAATDYALLYTARYREELLRNRDKARATLASIKGAAEPIFASGGTVIAGLMCLLLSDLTSNSSLGPVAAIGVLFAMASALTLLPALLFAFGRTAYWPRRPRYQEGRGDTEQMSSGPYARIGRGISRRPRLVWIACTALLLIGVALVPQLRADGVAQSELVLGTSDARDGQERLAEHFPGGSGTPLYALTPEDNLDDVATAMNEFAGVDSVAITADAPGNVAPLDSDATPIVSNGDVLLQATLSDASDSAAAADTARDIRANLGDLADVGGETAVAIDSNDTAAADRNLIIPIVLLAILVILMLLLRSILAPVLLVATTVLSFGTAMGVSAVVFNDILAFPGADPSVPLYGFVFLVALGIDYNIFLMNRVREEALGNGNAEGIRRGLTVTGGVITSAGIVLAATFAALAVIPILFLVQLAFIVAFGVLLDTFLVRTLLVPALGLDIGKKLWWPSRSIGA